MEYQFNESVQGRFGFNDGDLTAGFSYIRDSWRVDYAYKKAELGDTNRFSTGFRFNTFLLERFFDRPKKPQCGTHKLNNHNTSCGANNNKKGISLSKIGTGGMTPDRVSDLNNENIQRRTLKPQPNINTALGNNDEVTIKSVKNSGRINRRGNLEKLKNRGNKLLLSGKYDEAAGCYSEMVRIAPSQESGHIKLAGIYHYQKKYDESIEEYKDAIAANPANLDNYINVATLYAKLQEYDKAAEAALIVTKLSPSSPKGKMAKQMYNTFTGRRNSATDGYGEDIIFENEKPVSRRSSQFGSIAR
jgi:tetratricopeptide (TPR) repeat protein